MSDDPPVLEKRWTTESIDVVTDQKLRWRIGWRTGDRHVEFESDSLWLAVRLMFRYWRQHRTTTEGGTDA